MCKTQIKFDGLDTYTLTVNGTITPVNATKELNFLQLYNFLIKHGFDENEANDMVKELCQEIVDELNGKGNLV